MEKDIALSTRLSAFLVKKGASLVGYGDLTGIEPENRRSFETGVSIAVKMTPAIVKGIENGPTPLYYGEYQRLNRLLAEISKAAEDFLIGAGYEALAKVPTVISITPDHRTELPHKTVATRAGIGWIGNCALLVTKQYGSAVRLSSVLTNAPLVTAKPVNESKCGGCTVCKNICPGKAVSGKNWCVGLDRDEFYDAFACRKTARARSGKAGIDESLCGLCLLKCPYTQAYLNKSDL